MPFNNKKLVIFICREERKRGETAKGEVQSREEVGKTQERRRESMHRRRLRKKIKKSCNETDFFVIK